MNRGQVKKWIEPRRYGFIAAVDGSTDHFFHYSGLASNFEPHPGQEVSFDLQNDPRSGRLRAVNVRAL